MQVIVDGDAVFVAADDFVNLAESEVVWFDPDDIDEVSAKLERLKQRDRSYDARNEAAIEVVNLMEEAERQFQEAKQRIRQTTDLDI